MISAQPPAPSASKAPLKAPPGGPPGLDNKKKGEQGDGEEELVPQLSFWQTPWVQDVLPFVSSLTIHISLILIGYAFYQAAVIIIERVQQQGPPAQTEMIDNGDVFNTMAMLGSANGVAGSDAPLEKNYPQITPEEALLQAKEGNGKPAKLGGGGAGEQETEAAIIGIGPGQMGKGKLGIGRGEGEYSGDGIGKGLPFGYRNGVDGGTSIFRAPPRGSAGGVRLVAFVCDASGSMLQAGKFDMLRMELQKAVGSLSPIHGFNVILFKEKSFLAVDTKSLMTANEANKKRTFTFLDDVMPQGATDPIPALDAAFKQGPELIFLLTDGDFPDNTGVISWIRSHNTGKKIKISTIAFVDAGKEYESTLKTIATENGGTYKFVDQNDLKPNSNP